MDYLSDWIKVQPFGHVVLYGGGIGCALYLLSRLVRWAKPDGVWVFESVAAGCGIVMGAHLAYCMFHTDHLVHLREGAKGRELAPAELHAKDGGAPGAGEIITEIDLAHSIHIFGAGILTAVLSGLALGRVCVLKSASHGSG